MTKKKTKALSIKKLQKSENPITVVDALTFYVKSETDPTKEPYFVYNSMREGYLCDCMAFVMNIQDSGKHKDCKHIIKVKEYLKKQK